MTQRPARSKRAFALVLLAAALGAGWLLVARGKGEPEPGGPPSSAPGARAADAPAVAPRSRGGAATTVAPLERAGGSIELEVRADGAPRASARVQLFARGERDPNTGLIVWSLAGAAVTGADGLAHLDAGPGRYVASAALDGYAAGRVELRRALGEPVTRARLELHKAALLSGRTVMRGSHEPVPLAEIVCTPDISPALRSGPEGAPDAPPELLVRAISDASGQFTVPGLSPGLWRIAATAAGGGRGTARAIELPRSGPLLLELVASAYIEGHIVGADGSPAPFAELTARAPGGSEHAQSTASGAFSIEVAPGAWLLSARRGSEAGALAHAVAVAEGQTKSGVELRLGAGAAIAGLVLHKGDGAPLAGARISVSPHDEDGDSGRGLSGVDGHYSVEALAPGTYDVVAELQGYRRSETRGVALGAGQRFELGFELSGSGAVEGRVGDAQGRAIAGARVEGAGVDAAQARTDADGRYRIASIPAGRVTLGARRPDAALGAEGRVEVKEGETAHLDFVLKETGRVVGRVRRANGPLPEGVQVSAMRNQRAVNAEDITRAPVSPDGDYQLELPAGSYRLQATAGNGAASSSRDQLAVEAGETLTHDLTLPDASGLGLTVQVLEPGGAPSPFAQLILSASRFGQMERADESGQVQIARPRSDLPDTLQLSASNGARTGIATVGPGVTQATVQLQAAASLHGKLTGGSAIDAFTLLITWEAPTGGPARAFSGAEAQSLQFLGDAFDLPDQAAGSYTLRALTSDGRSGEAETAVAPGGSAEVLIALVPAASLVGRAVDESGAPLPEAVVFLDREMARPDASGAFRFDAVAPGPHHLGGFLQPASNASLDVEVAQGQRLDVGALVFKGPKTGAGMIGISLRGDSSGVFIDAVTPDSPAEQAGLLPGDQIVAVDGNTIAGISDTIARIRGAPGTSVLLTLQRNGRTFSLQVQRSSGS